MPKTAIAIFVKTIGYSGLKTRLAKSIGQEAAEEFYRMSFQTIESTLVTLQKMIPHVAPIWAVAEKEAKGHSDWKQFPTIVQPSGNLGERLAQVYEELMEQYDQVIFMGADAPHASLADFEKALNALDTSPFALGEATDGGYWLFAGRQKIPTDVWTSVRYSTSKTAKDFKNALKPLGEIAKLDEKVDVDTLEDLEALYKEKASILKSLPSMERVFSWCEKNKFCN